MSSAIVDIPSYPRFTFTAFFNTREYFHVAGSGLTYVCLCQVFSYPLKFCRQTGIRFRTFAQTIDRLTPSSDRS